MTERVHYQFCRLLSGCLTVLMIAAESFAEDTRPVRSILEHRCLQCHEGEEAEAGIDLSEQQTTGLKDPDIKKWKQVLRVLRSRAMPPRGEEQFTTDERKSLTVWIENVLSQPDADSHRDPGGSRAAAAERGRIQRLHPRTVRSAASVRAELQSRERCSHRTLAHLAEDDAADLHAGG